MQEVPHLSTPHVFVEWAAGRLRIKGTYSGERCVRGLFRAANPDDGEEPATMK
jgi:hypothetical protein